jgi:hypothetical protein
MSRNCLTILLIQMNQIFALTAKDSMFIVRAAMRRPHMSVTDNSGESVAIPDDLCCKHPDHCGGDCTCEVCAPDLHIADLKAELEAAERALRDAETRGWNNAVEAAAKACQYHTSSQRILRLARPSGEAYTDADIESRYGVYPHPLEPATEDVDGAYWDAIRNLRRAEMRVAQLEELLGYCVENIQGIADGTDIPSIAIREAALAALARPSQSPEEGQ